MQIYTPRAADLQVASCSGEVGSTDGADSCKHERRHDGAPMVGSAIEVAFNGLLACTLSWLDRRDDAARLVARAAEDRFEHIAHDSVRSTALTLFADAAAQAGDSNAAEILYELIEPWGDLIVWTGPVTEGPALTYLGLLAAARRRDPPSRFGRRPSLLDPVERHALLLLHQEHRPSSTSVPSIARKAARASAPVRRLAPWRPRQWQLSSFDTDLGDV
jgi:hypothetical protein